MHHEVFHKCGCWEGIVEAGFEVNFLGVMTRTSFAFVFPQSLPRRHMKSCLPVIDEEYFEWIDVLESAVSARGVFPMIELGAGWGRWLVNAAVAVRRYSGLPHLLVGVEAEPTHFEWMERHLQDNGIDRSRCHLIRAAVTTHDGTVSFHVGDPYNWYGQGIEDHPHDSAPHGWLHWTKRLLFGREDRNGRKTERVRAISLRTLLTGPEFVDLIDMDIQGAELNVLRPAIALVDEKVKRVHVGTHGEEIEAGLRETFREVGWQSIRDHPSNSEIDTPWGRVAFGDGVQSWVNPRWEVTRSPVGRIGVDRSDR